MKVKDESIHGVFVGILAQQIFAELSAEDQQEVQKRNARVINGTI
ncbi:hypothetical protein ACT7C4_21165 [Bacillus pacificus]